MSHIVNSELIFLGTVRQIEKRGDWGQLVGPMMPPEQSLRAQGYLKYDGALIRTTLRGRVRNFIAQRLGR